MLDSSFDGLPNFGITLPTGWPTLLEVYIYVLQEFLSIFILLHLLSYSYYDGIPNFVIMLFSGLPTLVELNYEDFQAQRFSVK